MLLKKKYEKEKKEKKIEKGGKKQEQKAKMEMINTRPLDTDPHLKIVVTEIK